MAEFDEKVRSTTEEIERLKKAIEEVKTTIKSYEDMNNFSGGGYEDIINEEIRGLQALNKELDKAKEKLDNLTKVNRGNGHKVKANYENAVLGVEYEKQKNGGVISAEREYEILEKYFKKMSEGTNDSIKTARRMQEVMDRIDYTSAIKRALPSVEKYNALVDEYIQKNGKITDKDRLGIAQDLLSKTNSRSRDYFALNTIASKLRQKIEAEKLSSKPVDTKSSKDLEREASKKYWDGRFIEHVQGIGQKSDVQKAMSAYYTEIAREAEKAEQEQTHIAQQQASERVRIAQDEHNKKMQFFDKEYIYSGKEYSTADKLKYFTEYADKLQKSNNFIGMQDEQTKQYEQAMSKVRSLTAQLNKEQEQQTKQTEQEAKQAVDSIKNKVQEACQFIISAVSKAIGIVKWAISSTAKTATAIIGAFRQIGSVASRIIGLLGNFANRVRGCTKDTNLLKKSWTELRSMISLVSGALNRLTNNQFINEGKKLLSSIETLNTLIGKELTQSTIDWANNLEAAFGIDAAGLISDMREVTGVIKGLGMSYEDTAVAAQNLVSVGQTMSAVIGLDTQTVMNKLYSGMRGMTVAIDDIGLSVRETQMDSFLKKLKAQGGDYANIGTSFSQLSEQQRVYVRYAALMDQFNNVYKAENYAKALESITGKMNILSQRLRALKQLIGNFAIQVFNKFVMPLTYAIDLLTAKLKNVFSGIMQSMGLNSEDLDLSTGMNHTTVAADDLAQSYDDVAKSAEEAAKASAGLDEFDHVSTLGSSSSASGKDNFDYSSLMDYGDNYAKLLEDIAKENAKYNDKLRKSWGDLLTEYKTKWNDLYKGITGGDFNFYMFRFNLGQVKNIAKNIANVFKKTFSEVFKLGIIITDDMELGLIITKTLAVANNMFVVISQAIDKVSPYIEGFYNRYLRPYVEAFGRFVNEHLDGFIKKTEEWSKFWNSEDSNGYLDNLFGDSEAGAKFDEFKKKIEELIEAAKIAGILIKTLFTGETTDADLLKLNEVDKSGSLSKVNDIFTDIHDTISTIVTLAGELGEDFGDWFKTEGLSDIENITDKISKLMSEHKDDIKKILEQYAQMKWDVITAICDKVLDICDWLVQHPDEVCETIETISAAIQTIVDNIEWVIGAGVSAKIANTFAPLLTYASIKGIAKGAATTAGTTTTATAGAGATGAGTLLGNLFAPVTLATLVVEGFKAGGTGIHDVVEEAVETGSVDAINRALIKLNGADAKGFSVSAIDNQAAATIKEIRRLYGDAIEEETFDSLVAAYKVMLKNTDGLTEAQINSYTEYFEYALKRDVKNPNWALNLAYDPTQAQDTIGSYLNDIERTLEYGAKIVEIESNNMSNDLGTVENSVGSLSNVVETETTSMYTNFSTFGSGVWTSEQNVSNATISINSALESVKNTFNSVKSAFAEQITAKFSAMFNTNAGIDTSKINWSNGIKTSGLNTFYGHANGGTPKSGSLFFANENGNSELVGNFGGYAGVANQNMIIQAMENAVARGMAKAGTNNNSGNMVFNICQGGMFVGDQSSVRKLANMINSTNNVTNKTIANSAFSMN